MKLVASKWVVIGAAVLAVGGAIAQGQGTLTFAVSGDSRNCGDVIMPAIAQKVIAGHDAFYWHLGDFRAMQGVDQDMIAAKHGPYSVQEYLNRAWPDFIEEQLAPFKDVPVYLGLGNHEMVGRTRADAMIQFADWFNTPVIRQQRLADDPTDHKLRPYFHFHEHGVDFITMDNAAQDQFDADQVAWLEKILKRDAQDVTVKSLVLGMHEALPDSLGTGHSMNNDGVGNPNPVGTYSGRKVYKELVDFRKATGKEVQVIASHSHFLMNNVYKTSCRKDDEVLPGWIVGTAGAVRYRLPVDHAASTVAQTDVYGYLQGTVSKDGRVTFAFHPVVVKDIPESVMKRYGKEAVMECFNGNRANYVPEGATCDVK